MTHRFELDGAVEGWATVTGTWSGGQFRAERQDPPVPRPAERARWVTPPCPPPEGPRQQAPPSVTASDTPRPVNWWVWVRRYGRHKNSRIFAAVSAGSYPSGIPSTKMMSLSIWSARSGAIRR